MAIWIGHHKRVAMWINKATGEKLDNVQYQQWRHNFLLQKEYTNGMLHVFTNWEEESNDERINKRYGSSYY